MFKSQILRLKDLLYSGNERSQIVKKNAVGSLIIRILSIGIDFAKVPVLLSYLTPENYGLYVTITSIVYWTHNFDFGLGTGLRYKLTAAITKSNFTEGKSLVSTAYVSMSVLLTLIFLIVLPVIYNLHWNIILNAPNIPDKKLILCVLIVLILFLVQFVLELITYVLQAYQKSALSMIFKPIANCFTLIVILSLKIYSSNSLFLACLGMSIPILIVLAISNIIIYRGRCKRVSPSIRYYDKKCLKDIYSLGIKFFVSQICNLVVFQSASILISHYIDPAEAAAYNTAFTYFGAILVFNTMMLVPLSAAVTDAYIKEDFDWIKNIMKQIRKISILLSLMSITTLVLSPVIFPIWLGDKLNISWMLRISMTIYFILNIWTTPYSSFISGVGKMNVAMISNLVKTLIYLPTAILLVSSLGTYGIMIAIILINTLPNNIIYSIQYRKIVTKRAVGIWNR